MKPAQVPRRSLLPLLVLVLLAGLVIGAEIAEILPAATGTITLIGDPALADRYGRALAARGLRATVHTGEACALAGLALLETP